MKKKSVWNINEADTFFVTQETNEAIENLADEVKRQKSHKKGLKGRDEKNKYLTKNGKPVNKLIELDEDTHKRTNR